jgi:hypothetical protein
MSIRRDGDGTIVLDGSCPVEDAEPLLQMLQATPAARVEWTHCHHLHTAVVQVILAARPALGGGCGDTWLRQWLAPNLE